MRHPLRSFELVNLNQIRNARGPAIEHIFFSTAAVVAVLDIQGGGGPCSKRSKNSKLGLKKRKQSGMDYVSPENSVETVASVLYMLEQMRPRAMQHISPTRIPCPTFYIASASRQSAISRSARSLEPPEKAGANTFGSSTVEHVREKPQSRPLITMVDHCP